MRGERECNKLRIVGAIWCRSTDPEPASRSNSLLLCSALSISLSGSLLPSRSANGTSVYPPGSVQCARDEAHSTTSSAKVRDGQKESARERSDLSLLRANTIVRSSTRSLDWLANFLDGSSRNNRRAF